MTSVQPSEWHTIQLNAKYGDPPKFRHGVILKYADESISIAQRGDDFAIVHIQNARWFVTDKNGAEIAQRFAEHLAQSTDDFACSYAEQQFLKLVKHNDFFAPARDAPSDIPSVLCISLTDRCNLECSYCFYSASHEKNRDALHVTRVPENELRRVLQELHLINPAARVYLTGGEPFINTEILSYFRMIKDAKLYAGVVTNGVFLNNSRLAKMQEIGVDEIRISLDGVTRDTHESTRPGTFDKVMGALARLNQYKFHVVLSMTVTNKNQHEAISLGEFARARNFVVSYSHMVPTGRGLKNQTLLPDYEQLVRDFATVEESVGFSLLDRQDSQGWRRHTCGLAGQSLYMDLNGDTAPCNMLSKTGHNLGNAFDTALSSVLNGQPAKNLRASVDDVRYCQNCHVRYICGGPCRASSHFAVGILQSRGPDCAFKYAEVIDSIFAKGDRIFGEHS